MKEAEHGLVFFSPTFVHVSGLSRLCVQQPTVPVLRRQRQTRALTIRARTMEHASLATAPTVPGQNIAAVSRANVLNTSKANSAKMVYLQSASRFANGFMYTGWVKKVSC